MKHELKIWPEHFQAIADRRKRFEVRSVEDRSFGEGDTLHLREWMQDDQAYTGRDILVRVDLVHAGIGTMQGFVVMSISILSSVVLFEKGAAVGPSESIEKFTEAPTIEAFLDLEARVAAVEGLAYASNIKIHAAQCGKAMHAFDSIEQWAEKLIPEEHGAFPQRPVWGDIPASQKHEWVLFPDGSCKHLPCEFDGGKVVTLGCAAGIVRSADEWLVQAEAAKSRCRIHAETNIELNERCVKAEARVKELEAQVKNLQVKVEALVLRVPPEGMALINAQEWEELNEFFVAYDTMQETHDFQRRHLAWSKIHDRRQAAQEGSAEA